MSGARYQSPLSTRYASPAMQALWGDAHRAALWRRLWLALMETEKELGLAIPDEAVAALREHLDDANLSAVTQYERRFRHDVMAHIHALGDQAPAARPYLHLGATSAFVADNADLLVMRDGLRLLLGRLIALLRALAGFAERHASLPCLAYTHFQPAQLTTVGKRAVLWAQDFLLDAEEICYRLETVRFRGCKGTTGTQASFLELFGGDHARVRELDRRVTERMGFARSFAAGGQTYSRKQDSAILDTLSGLAQSAAKLAGDLRLLQHEGELLEPFESEQIGSSAMAYKRNPMRAERISGLARFLISLQQNTAQTAASQWLERTLDDSANRRLVLPQAFLTADAILILATNVATGLEVREAVIARHVEEQMPFMATERWLMLGVQAGGDRQGLHEVIRTESLRAAEEVSAGKPNVLLERMAAHPAFRSVPATALAAELEPARYTGRSEAQVGEFLRETLAPALERAGRLAAAAESAEVSV
ncbi:MAG: adenylosuccinate lyase [Gemmatimonadales bacterium]